MTFHWPDFHAANRNHKRRVPNQTEPYPTNEELEALYNSNNGICPMCECTIAEWEPVDLDHIRPIIMGGLHTLENLRFVHQHCNRKRKKRPLIPWLG